MLNGFALLSDFRLALHNRRYEDYQQEEMQKEEDYSQKWDSYWSTQEQDAGVSTSSSETTTTSGDVIPTHVFRKYHQGFDVASWQAHEKAVASDIKDYETDYVNGASERQYEKELQEDGWGASSFGGGE